MKLYMLTILIALVIPISGVYALDTFTDQDKYSQTAISKEDELISRTRSLMGTYATILLPQKNNSQISSSFDLIQNIEDSLSTYDLNATLAQLNKKHKVEYDDFLAESIKLSKLYYKETDGFFDITIGSISKKLYHFGEEKTYSPSKDELRKAHLNIDGIHINKQTIQSDKNIVIDLGGMGKGYAVDKVVSYIKEQNITKGIIALSGDIQCLNACDIYLQSPYSTQTFAKVTSENRYLSISTSGTYRRYATTPEEHHLINPKTALQGRDFVSVSLFTTANNAKIDAYATAISVMPRKKAIEFLKTLDDIGFLIVDSQSKIIYGNLDELLKFEFLDYNDTATMKSMSKNNKTKINIEKSFIHPDTINPKVIRP